MDDQIVSITPLRPERLGMDASNDSFPFDEATTTRDAVVEKLADALTPGYQAEFDPAEAEMVGAFAEHALSESDALASTHDLVEDRFQRAGTGQVGPIDNFISVNPALLFTAANDAAAGQGEPK